MTVIGVDLDDVVLDFTGTWQRLYRTWFDQEPVEQTAWTDVMGAPQFESKEEFFRWFVSAKGWDQINWSPAYIPGAPGAILQLMERYTVHFVTARDRAESFRAAHDWWNATPWRNKTYLTCTPNKETVKAKVYVDDSPIVADRLVSLGRNVVLIDRPWNQDFGDFEPLSASDGQWVRAHNWAEALIEIDRFAGRRA